MAISRTQEEIDAAAAEVDEAAAAVARTARRVRQAAAQKSVEENVDQATDGAFGMKATFDGVLADAKEAFHDAQAPIRRFVQEHPIASLAAVAGVAMLILRRPR